MPPLALDRQDERGPADAIGGDRPVERDLLCDLPHEVVGEAAALVRAVLIAVVQLVDPTKRLVECANDDAAQCRAVGECGEVRRCARLLKFRAQRRRPSSVVAVRWLLLPSEFDPRSAFHQLTHWSSASTRSASDSRAR